MDSDVDDYLSSSVPLQIPEELDVVARRARVLELQHTNARTVSTLPLELLSYIFQECGCPLSLSHVSRLFRSVAIGTPILWSQITHVVGLAPFDMTRTAAYLRRSQTSPLSIYLGTCIRHSNNDDDEDDDEDEDDHIGDISELHSVLDLLIPHVHRWEEFELDSDCLSGIGICIARLAKIAAPNLQRLHIDMWGLQRLNVATEVLTESTIFGLGAPRLVSVKLYGIPPLYCLPPLRSATTLHIRDLSSGNTFASLFSTLNGLSHLTHLSLDTIDCNLWSSSPRTIHLPALTSLAIYVNNDLDLIAGVLNALSSPSLQSLILDDTTEEDLEKIFICSTEFSKTLMFPLVRFLTVGFCSTCYKGSAKNTLEQLATVFPHVTHFTLRDTDPTREYMSRLGESALLGFQHLHTFTWGVVELSADSQSTVVSVLFQLITKRCRAGLGIQVLRVTQDILDGVIYEGRVGNLEGMVERVDVCELPQNLVDNWLCV